MTTGFRWFISNLFRTLKILGSNIESVIYSPMGRDTAALTATHYGMDGPRIEFRWGGGEIFRTRPDRPLDPSSLLCTMGTGLFLGVKRPGRGVDHTPTPSAEVKGSVELTSTNPLSLPGLF